MAANPATAFATVVADEFRRRIIEEYIPRISRCVALLSPEEIWHRPGPESNAIGNLLLHLEGNVRQWVHCGIAEQTDIRNRDLEFSATAASIDTHPDELVERLRETAEQAATIVDDLGPHDLLEQRCFQERYDETCLSAVLHVMEHFSGHAGQIYAFTKQLKAVDLKFYEL